VSESGRPQASAEHRLDGEIPSTICLQSDVMPSVTGTMRCNSRTLRKRHRTIRYPTVSIATRFTTVLLPGRGARHAFCAWVSILFLTGALSGCALFDTYEKCGFRGCAGDANITADVVLQLNRCSFLEPNVISVQTIDHVVYLNGVVRSGLEIGTAESIAGQVPGVARVVNSIAVFTAR
jgi:hypothetical protein